MTQRHIFVFSFVALAILLSIILPRPIPYRSTQYQPEKERSIVLDFSSSRDDFCLDDMWCKRNGCGNICTSLLAPSMGGTCPPYWALGNAFCGCVDWQCRWFIQEGDKNLFSSPDWAVVSAVFRVHRLYCFNIACGTKGFHGSHNH